MANLKDRDKQVIWHPYTPTKAYPEAIGIVKGEGVYLFDEEGNEYIDAISSWWVNLHGHAHPYIVQQVCQQMSQLEHCIFAGFTHEPAIRLAERLLDILPKGMSKIFYSDNGSTAVEVALKMALQYWINKSTENGVKKAGIKNKIIALENAYHGDTFGAMAVSGRSIFTDAFKDLLFDVTFIPCPRDGNEEASILALEKLLQQGNVAAFIAEPLVQGSAGMLMYSAEVLEKYFGLCKQYSTIIIADEVMTGFGRTGPLFASNHIQTQPDIICLSKGLTGGFMPMGITATTLDIYNAFYDDDKTKMLYHGHSYTANATSCAAALASLDLLLAVECTENRKRIIAQHAKFAATITGNELVTEVRQTGTILAIEIKTDKAAYHSSLRDRLYYFFIAKNIIMRPLGNIIYILPPYVITNQQLEYIYKSINELLIELNEG